MLDWVHAITTQIPDARRHMVRYCGAYANRARRLYRVGDQPVVRAEPARCAAGDEEPDWVKTRRRSWARLLRRIYELDPFVCPRCQGEMKIIAVITEPSVVSRTLSKLVEQRSAMSRRGSHSEASQEQGHQESLRSARTAGGLTREDVSSDRNASVRRRVVGALHAWGACG